MELKTNINLRNAGFTIPQVMRKKRGTPGTLVVDAHYTIPEELVIDNFELVIDNAKLDGKMQVKTGSEPWFMTSFNTLDFPLESLNRLPAICFDEGRVKLAAEVWQASQAQGGMRYRGDATVEHATLLLQAMNKPIRDLHGKIEMVNDRANVHSASFVFGESLYQMQAEIADFNNPRIIGQLSTDALDINEIVSEFAKTKTSAEKSTSSKAVPQPDFSIEVLVEAGAMCFGKARTGAVSTIWRTSGRAQEFAPFHIDAFGGELKGVFDLAVLENGNSWAVDLSGEDMALEVIFDQLLEGKIKGEPKGLLSAKGNLSGVASRKKEDMWRSMDGTLTLTATDGEIKQSPLFNSMLLAMRFPTGSIANILLDTVKTRGRALDVTRMIFKKVDGTFQLTDGLARTEDLFFDGETVDLLFKGDLDLVREQMDMKIKATTPTGSIGSLLHKVPVAGKGWDRAKKSVLSLSFIARGPISNPKVQLSAVERFKPERKKK
ncbi:MAG: AsmA-like C-terminal region-containing protein [Deltaproteobacteria bacterium]|nr:AsmA-like C-terminal region-containing protein [Deltaproteobacteria bacterium]